MSLSRMLINGAATGISIKMALYNDALREQVINKQIVWQPYMGYLSDFFVPAAIVSGVGVYASLINYCKRKRYDAPGRLKSENSLDNLVLGSALITASAFSVIEQINNFGNKATSGEWNDVFCYFLGASLAYVAYNLSDVFEKNFKWEK